LRKSDETYQNQFNLGKLSRGFGGNKIDLKKRQEKRALNE
jgi:hypothetical protein